MQGEKKDNSPSKKTNKKLIFFVVTNPKNINTTFQAILQLCASTL